MNMNEARREALKQRYPAGTRLEVISMSDEYHPVPAGTRGTVTWVDDCGTVFVSWDNGQGLGLIPGEDVFRKLTEQELLQEQSADYDQSQSM